MSTSTSTTTPVRTERPTPTRPRGRRALRVLASIGVLLTVTAASIAFGLRVAPERTVHALGQTVSVGTAPPTWHLKGPGQAVLFGQVIPTQVDFYGPVRPQLTLTDISLNEQVTGLFSPGPHASVADSLGSALGPRLALVLRDRDRVRRARGGGAARCDRRLAPLPRQEDRRGDPRRRVIRGAREPRVHRRDRLHGAGDCPCARCGASTR